MLFNSLSFAYFLPVVFALYWLLARRGAETQNLLLLAASWYFYSCWDPRFLGLLLFSTLLDYGSGLRIAGAAKPRVRKAWLVLSVGVNLGFLALFKYYDFFIGSFAAALGRVGMHADPPLLHVLLPVGISFYTFHGLSYVIDCYRGSIRPERHFVTYALFVSFFPLLVAGPIERATHLLPQLKAPRRFRYEDAAEGLRQMLWGFFKKVVVADNCAHYVNLVFSGESHYSGSQHALGALLFAIQIYSDFSGYSDIALGTARLFGIDLLRNFAHPYFSRDIAEFWRRWHISLSSWFRDYLYIPLGGSRHGRARAIRNTFIIFLVSGLWHGANWTFLAWGGLHALFFLPLLLAGRNRVHLSVVASGRLLPSLADTLRMAGTFALVTLAWVFFRAASIGDALRYLRHTFQPSLLSLPGMPPMAQVTLLLSAFLFGVEWLGRERPHALAGFGSRWPRLARWSFYALLLFLIGMYMVTEEQPFLYFQF
ncbi:MAG: MBOAT family protein [Chitinophagaceae bacterium]|nr:MAG: MBOAT family protein [Chitinophagaceae bacterium]